MCYVRFVKSLAMSNCKITVQLTFENFHQRLTARAKTWHLEGNTTAYTPWVADNAWMLRLNPYVRDVESVRTEVR